MSEEARIYTAWLKAASEHVEALPANAHTTCPSCRADALASVVIGDREERIGYAHVWCGSCNKGIRLSRVGVSGDAPMLPFGLGEDELEARIPSYEVVSFV